MPRPILFYDGVCGLCNRFVQFVLRRDPNAVFRFAPLQSALAASVLARHGANHKIVFGEDIDPDAAISALDAVTYDEVREVAAGVADNLAVACVGPHSADEF